MKKEKYEYLSVSSFILGKQRRFIFKRTEYIKEIHCCILSDSNKLYITADEKIVKCLKNTEAGGAVEIIFTGFSKIGVKKPIYSVSIISPIEYITEDIDYLDMDEEYKDLE